MVWSQNALMSAIFLFHNEVGYMEKGGTVFFFCMYILDNIKELISDDLRRYLQLYKYINPIYIIRKKTLYNKPYSHCSFQNKNKTQSCKPIPKKNNNSFFHSIFINKENKYRNQLSNKRTPPLISLSKQKPI